MSNQSENKGGFILDTSDENLNSVSTAEGQELDLEQEMSGSSRRMGKIKKSLMRGYSPKNVNEYIAHLQMETQQVKQQLEKQIEGLLAEKRTVTQECDYLHKRIKETERKLQNANAQMENMVSPERLEEVQEKLAKTESSLEQAKKELDGMGQLRAERDHLEAACADNASMIKHLERSYTDSKIEQERLNRQNRLLEVALRGSKESVAEEIQKILTQNQTLETAYENLCKQIDSYNETAMAAEVEKEEMEQLRQQLAQERKLLQTHREQFDQEKKKMLHSINEKVLDLQQREEAVQAAENALTQKETLLQEGENNLAQHETTVRQTEEALAQRESLVQEAENALAQREAIVLQTEETLAQKEARIQEAEREFAQRDASVQQKEETLAKREALVQEAEKALAQREASVQQAEEDLEQRRSTLQADFKPDVKADMEQKPDASAPEGKREKENLYSLYDAFAQMMETLENQSSNMDRMMNKMQGDQPMIDQLLSQQQLLKNENADLQEARNAARGRISELEAENERLMRELQGKKRHESAKANASAQGNSAEANDRQQLPNAIDRAKQILQKMKEDLD